MRRKEKEEDEDEEGEEDEEDEEDEDEEDEEEVDKYICASRPKSKRSRRTFPLARCV